MAVLSGQVSVTSAGVAVVPAANAAWNPSGEDEAPSRYVVITNASTAIVYLGALGVTTSTGYLLATSGTVTLFLHPDEAVYGIVASTASLVTYLESGS